MEDLTTLVKQVLTDHKDARDDDFRVIGWVYKAKRPEVMHKDFGDVLWKAKELGLPSFETIRRTRQKIQRDNPNLRGEAYLKRMEKQTEYIEQFADPWAI